MDGTNERTRTRDDGAKDYYSDYRGKGEGLPKLGRRDDENQKRSSVVKLVGGTDEIKQVLRDTSSSLRFSSNNLMF